MPVPVTKRGKPPGTLKLPPTAVCNDVTGDWEETDPHRLAQRRKQLCFGKVTQGYVNYVSKVKVQDRQEGNEVHPYTPRLNQVCSKRSWDCQVGKWRRALHYWDSNPSADTMRKDPVELKVHKEQQPRLIVNPSSVQQPLVKVKYVANGECHCRIIMTPVQTAFTTFASRLEGKSGPLVSMYYSDADGDIIDVDDDVSLRAFLDSVNTASPPPKLILEAAGGTRNDVVKALRLIESRLSRDANMRLSQKLSIDLDASKHASTPPKKPIPELMDMITPTPEGKTPAMIVYNGLWTPETDCRERRKLFV